MAAGKKALIALKAAFCILTLGLLLIKLFAAQWGHAGLCLLSLALYFLPALLRQSPGLFPGRRYRERFPGPPVSSVPEIRRESSDQDVQLFE